MDMMRSFNLARSRMTSDTGEEFWVRWYPAAPGALPYPNWHAFGSSLWEDDLTDEFVGPGMFHEPLIWRGSTYPAPPGQEHHGLPEWFEFGLPTWALNITPMTELCGRPVIDPRGGIGLSGSSSMVGLTVPNDFTLDKITTPLPGGTVNNLNTGPGGAFRLNAGGPLMITGIVAGPDGRMIIVENIGPDPIFLLHQAGGSEPSNRIICMDGFSCRLGTDFAAWLQYDGSTARWRELSTVPIVREKGDLLTHTLTSATRLPVSSTPGHVLTADPGEDVGMKWAEPEAGGQGGGDLNFWRQAGSSRFGFEHWYLSTYQDVDNSGPTPPPQNRICAVPFISPRAGQLGKIGAYVASAGVLAGRYLLGIYDSISEDDLYPNELLASSAEFTGTLAGGVSTTIDLEVDGRRLYWLVYLGNNQTGSGLQLLAWTTPPHVHWPLFGHSMGVEFGGTPNPILITAAWTYDGELPETFPAGAVLDEFQTMPHIGVTYS